MGKKKMINYEKRVINFEEKEIDFKKKEVDFEEKEIGTKNKEEVSVENINKTKKQDEIIEQVVEISPLVMDTDKIMDTTRVFGKCKVIEDEIIVYNRLNFSRTSTQTILKKEDTFYFDSMHTTDKNNVYVSWVGVNGRRNYTLFKDNTGKMPVVKITLE